MPTVLIVEDDAMLQEAYVTVLKAEGYDVHAASDGMEGLTEAKELKPDLILLDMLMPTLNGLEFLQAYDVRKTAPETKVVVYSNMSVPSDVKDAMALGAHKYLTKSSFTPKEIAAIIKDVLNSGD